MPRCRNQKCLERQKEIVRKIMAKIPEEYRFDYEEVKKRVKPHITLAEWKTWKYEQGKKC